MNAEIKQLADNCEACQEMKARTSKNLLNQHDQGTSAWQKVGLDLFEIKGRNYLVTVDYYSNFIEVDYLSTTTSNVVIAILKKHFARYGVPITIVSDGGPQFASSVFDQFTKKWGIRHIKSSPHYPRANGKAESAVKTVKHLMYKCVKNNEDQFEALLELRNVPRQETGLSPYQMVFGKPGRTFLPSVAKKSKDPQVLEKINKRNKSVKKYHDKSARDLPKLKIGQNVYFEQKQNQQWILGKVLDTCDEHSYQVKAQDGATYRRNRIHIRPTKIEPYIRDKSPARMTNSELPTGGKLQDCQNPMYTPSDNVTKQCENYHSAANANELTETKTVESADSIKTGNEIPQTIRPKRECRKPNYLKDYVVYK
ncbi:uncharacterized protein K02A2.6-like [Lingula anatina]|uniref:Uncharacterized protein K02A2.6-like n=1 Tax=Lingula anatina TaxID=7574 RepID=A0A2R2MTV2_LINAN|nr:uncharacterized protein K02A2.6-like [Lingula anatina]|eukprot:XP_023933671.1 uncharacterized protein K02A2.6-like [Lingula anatina]